VQVARALSRKIPQRCTGNPLESWAVRGALFLPFPAGGSMLCFRGERLARPRFRSRCASRARARARAWAWVVRQSQARVVTRAGNHRLVHGRRSGGRLLERQLGAARRCRPYAGRRRRAGAGAGSPALRRPAAHEQEYVWPASRRSSGSVRQWHHAFIRQPADRQGGDPALGVTGRDPRATDARHCRGRFARESAGRVLAHARQRRRCGAASQSISCRGGGQHPTRSPFSFFISLQGVFS